jgi:isopenicillin N synthase-like dioxygenase
MSSFSDPPRLPIIDLSLFELGEPWRDHVAAQVDWAATEFGFFYVVGHGVESGTIESLLQLSRAFFRMGDEIKQRIHMSRGGRAWRGYFPVGGELTSGRPDLKEGLYFGEELPENDVRVRAGTPLHGRNLFPELPGFRGAVLDYMIALTGLGHKLMSSIGRSLQVKYGDSWIEVPYVPGSLVINVGDMLERLTAGRYTSALHRVINRSRQSRISMPFFFDPAFDAVLQPIPGVGPRVLASARRDRWDGLDLTEVDGTYGDYLLGKVSKVFPDLGEHHLRVS